MNRFQSKSLAFMISALALLSLAPSNCPGQESDKRIYSFDLNGLFMQISKIDRVDSKIKFDFALRVKRNAQWVVTEKTALRLEFYDSECLAIDSEEIAMELADYVKVRHFQKIETKKLDPRVRYFRVSVGYSQLETGFIAAREK